MTLFRDELGRVAVEVLDSLHRVSGESALEPHDIYSELLAIHTDFEGLDWDRQRQTLSVVVGPVELEGIRLGRFEIILQCDRLAERRPYEVVALTPNPASVDQQVTHPHVRGNLLCEGEGTPLIRLALDQGRLFDFFELVARVLDTYNPMAAHVSLTFWYGFTCADCGDYRLTDAMSRCTHCREVFCRDCMTSCLGCGSDCCARCRGLCLGCENYFCGKCRSACRSCGDKFCKECLLEDQCEGCREAETETKPKAAGLSTAVLESDRAGHAEVRAAGLGQTDVFPRLP